MSFEERARKVARDCAERLDQEAQQIAIFRSLDATRSAAWLQEIAAAIRTAIGPEPEKD